MKGISQVWMGLKVLVCEVLVCLSFWGFQSIVEIFSLARLLNILERCSEKSTTNTKGSSWAGIDIGINNLFAIYTEDGKALLVN